MSSAVFNSYFPNFFLEPISVKSFNRFLGSFEPLFDSSDRVHINYVYEPCHLNLKEAKIIPKIDEALLCSPPLKSGLYIIGHLFVFSIYLITQIDKTDMQYTDLLIPVVCKGKRVYRSPSLEQIQKKAQADLSQFHPGTRRFLYPQSYFVGLEKTLYETKLNLIRDLKNPKID